MNDSMYQEECTQQIVTITCETSQLPREIQWSFALKHIPN